MYVKWHGEVSSFRALPGGGPAGATIGILEYISQSSNSADMVDPDLRFKFIDDLSVLEVISLLSAGLTSVNIRNQVPNDIPIHNQFLPSTNLKTQQYLYDIASWTQENKMELNKQKTKSMLFNYTRNYQFVT